MMRSSFFKEVRAFYGKQFNTGYASPIKVEKAEQIFYINYLCEGMTVFDVGANIGELTLLFSRFVGTTGKVHAFEASDSMFKKLSQVCSIAGSSQVILNHQAIAAQEGMAELYVYDEMHSGWNSLANRPLEKYGIDVKPTHVEKISATTIDKYCHDNDIKQIDLLKLDIEGAEYQALLSAQRMLSEKRIGCCVFEFGGTTFDMGNTPEMIQLYLEEHGYRIRNVVQSDPIFPGRSSASQAQFSIHIAEPRL